MEHIKVFRIINSGNKQKGWFPVESNIKTSEITADSNEVATSIPNPFAQVSLVKTAFERVIEYELEGLKNIDDKKKVHITAHHRLVSNTLDIAQLFYLSEVYGEKYQGNKISIAIYNPSKQFGEHTSKPKDTGLYRCFDAFKLHFDETFCNNADFSQYNLFLLLNDEGRVLGGTCPNTLFFVAPDVKQRAKDLRLHGSNTFGLRFFDDYCPLYKRDQGFIEYLYHLKKKEIFVKSFDILNEYLDVYILEGEDGDNLIQRSGGIKDKIWTPEWDAKFDPCYSRENRICVYMDTELGVENARKRKEKIQNECDLVIQTKKEVDKPLIIPYPSDNFPHNKNTVCYPISGHHWDSSFKVDDNKNRLPHYYDEYPWLSQSDFLEDTIVKIPYPIDSDFFITRDGREDCKYLLPLKPLFFKYFDASDVKSSLTIKQINKDLVIAELKIPLRSTFITFSKEYKDIDDQIITLDIHLAIFPFLKFPKDCFKDDYYVGLLNEGNNVGLSLEFYQEGEKVNNVESKPRSTADDDNLTTQYFKCKGFDCIRLLNGNEDSRTGGIIIPKLVISHPHRKIHYAIDIGTTNTHIEYAIDSGKAQPFANDSDKPLWRSLLNCNPSLYNNGDLEKRLKNELRFEKEIIPFSPLGRDINRTLPLEFPVRSALVKNKEGQNTRNAPKMIFEANNYMLFERLEVPAHLELEMNIKWLDISKTANKKLVESYIEYLLTIIYYKTILLEGIPNRMKVFCLYPLSIGGEYYKLIRSVWSNAFKALCGGQINESNLLSVPENVGSYLYHRNECQENSLTIDIGGGSTDLALFIEGGSSGLKPCFSSSFKFGGNHLFGDGYDSEDWSGFVKVYRDQETHLLSPEDREKLVEVLNKSKRSVAYCDYLFNLDNIHQKSDFQDWLLTNKKLRLSLIFFFASIIYYTAKLFKEKQKDIKKLTNNEKNQEKINEIVLPQDFIFSGNVSRLASVMKKSDDNRGDCKFIRIIFREVFKDDNKKKIDNVKFNLIQSDDKGKVTCKGVLKQDSYYIFDKVSQISWQESSKSEEEDTENQENQNTDGDSSQTNDEEAPEKFIKIYNDFFKVFEILCKEWGKGDLSDKVVKLFKDHSEDQKKHHLFPNLDKGLQNKDVSYLNIEEETKFFYPLIGFIHGLTIKLANLDDETD